MKILILDCGAFTQPDINEILSLHHVTYKVIYYCFGNMLHDDFFQTKFSEYLKSDSYDAVFTINFQPLVAKLCHQYNLPYLSWSYDSPLNEEIIESSLHFSTNFIFLFDRIQTESYQKRGYKNIYHLPLAINPNRLNNIITTPADILRFSSEISFVGKFYNSTLPSLLSPLDDFTKGFINALTEAQSHIYGANLLSEVLDDEHIASINKQYQTKLPSPALKLTKEQLAYSINTYITRQERLLLVHLLSKHHGLNLYSRETIDSGTNLQNCGSADYFTDMPKIFKLSKLNLNITLKTIQSGIPLRAIDILGCGGLLFSNFQLELCEYFTSDVDFVQYDSIEDAAEKANYYLAHEEIRQSIAASGLQKAVNYFHYSDRLATIFKTAGLLL